MVAPVTYPAPSTTYGGGQAIGSWKRYKAGARQKKPYNLNLPYTFQRDVTWRAAKYSDALGVGYRNQGVGFSPYQMRSFSTRDASDYATARAQFANRIAGKFASEWRSDASLGASLAESRQAWSMMYNRIKQVSGFVLALKRFDFVKAARVLGVLKSPEYRALSQGNKLRRGSRSFANNYLEFHFGWSPLVGDLHNAMKVLESEIPLGHYSIGSAPPAFSRLWQSENSSNRYAAEHLVRFRGRVGADIRVSNPNLYLLSSLGLTNPASVAWEVVPFSFVVDWFYGVSRFIESYSTYHGITVENPYYTVVETMTCKASYWWRREAWQPWSLYIKDQIFTTHYMTRVTSLPQVTLQPTWTPLFEDKPRRALAACALLIQQFIGKR